MIHDKVPENDRIRIREKSRLVGLAKALFLNIAGSFEWPFPRRQVSRIDIISQTLNPPTDFSRHRMESLTESSDSSPYTAPIAGSGVRSRSRTPSTSLSQSSEVTKTLKMSKDPISDIVHRRLQSSQMTNTSTNRVILKSLTNSPKSTGAFRLRGPAKKSGQFNDCGRNTHVYRGRDLAIRSKPLLLQ